MIKHFKNTLLILIIFILLSSMGSNFVFAVGRSASDGVGVSSNDSIDGDSGASSSGVSSNGSNNSSSNGASGNSITGVSSSDSSSNDNSNSGSSSNNSAILTEVDTRDVNTSAVKTKSPSCLLMDAKSGKILYSKDAYSKRFPASTTKLMTAILTLENCQLTDTATVSHNAIFSIPVGYSHANLRENEELTIEQLLNVLLIPSANDAAIVLAEHISGSEKAFYELMNQKAKELGCLNTNFVNPNGIHNKKHLSTAYDLALIGKYAMSFPDITRIAKVTRYTLPATNKYSDTDRIFDATNGLINDDNDAYYKYATGLKTGYTDSAGYCIVSTAKKGDLELIAVILGSDSISERYGDCKTLFDYGFDNYSYTALNKTDDVVKSVEISNGTPDTKSLDILVKDDINVLLEKSIDKSNIDKNIEIDDNLKAPIAEHAVVGKITYTLDGKDYSSDLIAASTVYASGFEVILFRVLLVFLILFIIYRLVRTSDNSKSFSSNKAWKDFEKKNKKKYKQRNKALKNKRKF